MNTMIEHDVVRKLSALLAESNGRAVVLSDGDIDLGVLVSMEDYAVIRQAKAERFLKASAEFGEIIRRKAAEDGLTPDDVLKILDRKAS